MVIVVTWLVVLVGPEPEVLAAKFTAVARPRKRDGTMRKWDECMMMVSG